MTGTQERQTLIEEETTFKGSLDSKCPIVVNGTVEGDLSGPALLVNVGGTVEGNVKAAVIRSDGQLQGTFEAERFYLSGRVCDNTTIRAKTLEVKLAKAEEAPIIFGECLIEIGDTPNLEEILKRMEKSKVAKPLATKPVQAKHGEAKNGSKPQSAQADSSQAKKNKGKDDQGKRPKAAKDKLS